MSHQEELAVAIERPVGRLAPSPTGALHLGNARSFLLAWLSVRSRSGQIVLRIEDIDSPRVKPWAVNSTIEDLKWLGLDWDLGPSGCPDEEEPADSPYVQTCRLPRYREVLRRLRAAGCIYPCTCTRSEVATAASAPHENRLQPLEGPVYPGTCRPTDSQASRQLPDAFAWRMHLPAGEVMWRDRLLGDIRAKPSEQLGDFVIARDDGRPAYQLAVVVDDHDMGITEVVRGDDLVFSTFRQLAILDVLGWQPPEYCHIPLMVGPDGRRLAKRHGDTRLAHFRESGITAAAIVGYLAWTLQLVPEPAPFEASELLPQLRWSTLPNQPTIFEPEQGWKLLAKLSR